ncbi:MAG TPA: serine/threonine-protein kinase [Polyangiaceae bacterium]
MAAEDVDQVPLSTTHKVTDIGRYRLIAELARGGMGIVYLALVRGPGGFNKLFVVKELKTHLAEDPQLVDMFLEEARLAAKLSHPNVVQTIEVGSEGPRHYIAMEYLEGQSLNRVIARARKAGSSLPLQYHLYVLSHLLEGLQYAHAVTDFDGTPLALVHRDVSPHNVFVTFDGQVKVLDFGIAKALDSSSDTKTGVLKGKVSYMPPEQAAGQAIDRRADVFAVGAMLWEAAAGKRMWSKAQNDLQILHGLMAKQVPSVREAKPDLDPALERIIAKATAVTKEERYASAAELQTDLEIYLKGLAVAPFGARDVGRFVADMFAPERARVKGLIDNQLRVLRGFASGEHLAVDMAQLTSSSNPGGTPSGVEFRGISSGSHPVLPAVAMTASGGNPTVSERGFARIASVADSVVPPPKSGKKALLGTVAILGIGAVIGGAFVFKRAPAPAPETHAAAAAPSPAPAASPKLEPIHATITASPREAEIAIDDGPAQLGSFRGTLPRDGQEHTIRIQAAHYQAKALTFRADDDHTFDIALEALPATAAAAPPPPPAQAWHGAPRGAGHAAPPPAAAAPAAAAPPAPAAPAPSSPARSRQQIDTSDPYAH